MTISLILFVEVLVLGINHIKLNVHSLDNKNTLMFEIAMLISYYPPKSSHSLVSYI